MLVGMENMMTYFHTEPEYAKEILNRIMDVQLGIAQHYIKPGIEIVFYAEDLGAQSSLLHGPDLIRDFLMPEYRQIFDLYKPRGILSTELHAQSQHVAALEQQVHADLQAESFLPRMQDHLPAVPRHLQVPGLLDPRQGEGVRDQHVPLLRLRPSRCFYGLVDTPSTRRFLDLLQGVGVCRVHDQGAAELQRELRPVGMAVDVDHACTAVGRG